MSFSKIKLSKYVILLASLTLQSLSSQAQSDSDTALGALRQSSSASYHSSSHEQRTEVSHLFQVFTKVKNIPDLFKKQDPRLQNLNPESYYTLTLGMKNDNLAVNNYIGEGDDRGLTFGLNLKLEKKMQSGALYTLKVSEDLYTQDTGKRYFIQGSTQKRNEQQVVNEKIIEFLVSNANRGQLFVYEFGLGWHQIDSNPSSAASSLQRQWHDLFERTRKIINIEGPVNESGLLFDGKIGYVKIHDVNSFELGTEVFIGGRASGVEGASYGFAQGEVSAQMRIPFTNAKFKPIAGVVALKHENGQQNEYYAGFEVIGKKTKCGFKFSEYQGDLMNYVEFNKPNKNTGDIDMIASTYCSRRF